MQPIVLVGHKHDCPRHGEGKVISGNPDSLVDGRAVACVGDKTCCGATIKTGSQTHMIEGRSVARLGDKTSHGGSLIEGNEGWLVD